MRPPGRHVGRGGGLPDEAHGGCKAKGGAVFSEGRTSGDTGSMELTGANLNSFRTIAERTERNKAPKTKTKKGSVYARARLAGTAH